ncbi:MAG: tRNA 2-thiocytidine biosynthesis protein TtcA [Chlamydiales bacterium]|jgi:tRNA(Ile)-lysidine synthase TilS/MesJ|nr:tRNA 2-thiocytidine biosynthesis protein TtcA [Chlamydiales bacterium]
MGDKNIGSFDLFDQGTYNLSSIDFNCTQKFFKLKILKSTMTSLNKEKLALAASSDPLTLAQSPVSPPWTKLGKKMESAIRKALYEFKMLEQVDHVAVALSGGKDSLALLYMLKAISGRGFNPFKITAIHVGGAFTCGASITGGFLERICEQLDVELIRRETTQTLEELECYSCSRVRRSLLFQAAREVGASTIAFGHHKDDNAETLMMNLLHKGEFAGLLPKIPMVGYGVTIIRPLIFIEESDIIEFAKQHHFLRVTCRCPVGQNSMRKKVRLLLKEMEALFPLATHNVASASLNYGSDKALRP